MQLNADDDQASFRLGLLYEELQDAARARTHYQPAAQAGIPDAINNLSRLNLLDKKPALATPLLLKSLEETNKLSPATHYALLKNLGWARFQQGDYSEAASYLEEAIALQKTVKLDRQNKETALAIASPFCLLAQVKEAKGNPKAALTDWETCNVNHNPYIAEENTWAITARKKLKAEDSKQ